jgi:hypothetical protein
LVRPNHHFDVLVGIYGIADMKNCRLLPAREVVEARLNQMNAKSAAGADGSATGVRTPDGRRRGSRTLVVYAFGPIDKPRGCSGVRREQ